MVGEEVPTPPFSALIEWEKRKEAKTASSSSIILK
jgi:hypothetical protein